MYYITKDASETKKLAASTAKQLKGGETLLLYGSLGSGKTTFVSGLVDYFLPDRRVLSPTFIIVRHYQLDDKKIKNIIHADLYRMENKVKINELGLEDYIGRVENIVCIEWADRIAGKLPFERTDIFFEIAERDYRKITFNSHG